jgi:hypothetical protein
MSANMIVFDPRYFEGLKSGRKCYTIRLGKRDLRSGEIRKAVCRGEEFALFIKAVEFKHVGQLTDLDARKDGFESVQDLISVLENYYPGLRPDDWLTIINFQLVEKMGNE